MRDLLTWYLVVEVLGLACLPLAGIVLASLPDRGWALAKPLALVVLATAVWLPLVVFPALPFSGGWVAVVALMLIAANVGLVAARPEHGRAILAFARRRWAYTLASEAVFAGAFWLMGWLRSLNPVIEGTEKFMDEAFLSAIIRAPHLPPPDPWLSGYPINYYYFGHFILGMLAKLLATPSYVAFNLGIALTAGLTATAIFGVAANLSAGILATRRGADTNDGEATLSERARRRLTLAIPFGLFAVVAALVMGNLRAVGLWWGQMGSLSAAISWLGHPARWSTFDWWWPSRAIPNTITEFPSFSFLLSDLHAHVLALPYTVLAVGFALSFWLAPLRPGVGMFGSAPRAVATLVTAGAAIGALYAMNGWDLPTYLGLALITLALHQWVAHRRRLSADLARDLLIVAGSLAMLCLAIFLPFYLGFNTPSQGIGVVTGTANHLAVPFAPPGPSGSPPPADPLSRTYIGDEIAANGVMLFIAVSWLMTLAARRLAGILRVPALERAKLSLAARGAGGDIDTEVVTALGSSTAEAWAQSWAIVVGGALTLGTLTYATRLWDGWTLTWALALVAVAGWLVVTPIARRAEMADADRALIMPLGLIAVAAALIGVCEVVYLRDVFAAGAPRMNTIFKFYFQAWVLLAIGAAPALAWLLARLPDRMPKPFAHAQPAAWAARGAWALGLVALCLSTLVFPLGASRAIYPLGQPVTVTLNGLSTIQSYDLTPGDIAGIEWLNANVSGSPVIVEASSSNSEYSSYYARVSTFTGLPTILGWGGHEYQWRVNWLAIPANGADFAARLADLQIIYTSPSDATVLDLLRRYHASYLYVGPVEQLTYGAKADLSRFSRFLPIVYNAGGVTIYAVPAPSATPTP